MTLAPRRQRFAIVLPRFLVQIEDARIAAVAAAVAGIGVDWRTWRRIVA